MMVTYIEFKEMITNFVDDVLDEMRVSIDEFGARLQCDEDPVTSLLDFLEKAHNFIEFAAMMESEYYKIYSSPNMGSTNHSLQNGIGN